MNQEQIKVEEALLSLIDLYNKESEKDRLFFLKYRKNNPDSGLQKEPFIIFHKTIETKASQSEISEFLYYFGNIRLLKTFECSGHAESLIQSFGLLKFPVPYFILECQKEVLHREGFINLYLQKEKYNWTKDQKGDFISKVKEESIIHSFDAKSERKYLEGKFKGTIQEIKKIESDIQTRFGYFVNGFFDGEIFKATQSDLNQFFYHSEIKSGGCGSFIQVWKAFSNYVSTKNEVFFLKTFFSGKTEEEGLISIWKENPKKTIDEVLKKGYDLGLWDSENKLQVQRGSLYGSKKILLSGLYIALKGNSIKENLDFKKVGKTLCEFFSILIEPDTKEPFKSFQSGNQKIIEQFKKAFKLF